MRSSPPPTSASRRRRRSSAKRSSRLTSGSAGRTRPRKDETSVGIIRGASGERQTRPLEGIRQFDGGGSVCYGRTRSARGTPDRETRVQPVLSAAALIASLAFVVFVIVAIPALLQVRRTAQAAEQTLAALEREVRPLT